MPLRLDTIDLLLIVTCGANRNKGKEGKSQGFLKEQPPTREGKPIAMRAASNASPLLATFGKL
jgi:hypothetical protein